LTPRWGHGACFLAISCKRSCFPYLQACYMTGNIPFLDFLRPYVNFYDIVENTCFQLVLNIYTRIRALKGFDPELVCIYSEPTGNMYFQQCHRNSRTVVENPGMGYFQSYNMPGDKENMTSCMRWLKNKPRGPIVVSICDFPLKVFTP
jgi:hypothetical protein